MMDRYTIPEAANLLQVSRNLIKAAIERQALNVDANGFILDDDQFTVFTQYVTDRPELPTDEAVLKIMLPTKKDGWRVKIINKIQITVHNDNAIVCRTPDGKRYWFASLEKAVLWASYNTKFMKRRASKDKSPGTPVYLSRNELLTLRTFLPRNDNNSALIKKLDAALGRIKKKNI